MTVPEYPQSRVEQYLAAILEAGGGGGSGGSSFKVAVTASGTPPAQTFSSDKTYAEIYEAAIGGSLPYAIIYANNVAFAVLPLAAIYYGSGAYFGGAHVDESGVSQTALYIGADGTVDVADVSYPAT